MSESPTNQPDAGQLTLRYDGDDYRGRMSAREVSAVLDSLSDLAQGLGAADALGGNSPTVQVQGFNEGSFDIVAIIEAIGPVGYVFGAASSVGMAFVFWWKNMRRIVVSSHHDADRGTVSVTMRSGEVLEWTEEQWRIYNNQRVKRAVRGIAAPFRNGAALTIETPTQAVIVPAEDAYLFEPEEDDEPADEEHRFETWVLPNTISFDPTRRWRLWSRDTGDFAAVIEDRNFATDVHLGRVRIGRTDSFKVALRTVTTKGEHGKDIVRWFVERVIEHHPGAEQHELTDDADQGA